ncbi:MAG: four helix bundle protein [Thaumarchaeota archaeon]|nr:four helix bundle protein [Nitrososphaerota archaeon]
MERKKDIKHFRDLEVYQRGFAAAMKIFELTKRFPSEEKYSMVDQIRRSSRSVCSNLAESWRKRKYKAVFINKVTDAMSEGSETQTWLEFSLACKFISEEAFKELDGEYETILTMLNSVERNADKFCF